MKMTAELVRGLILEKKTKLQAAQQENVNNANACSGAIQICGELLVDLDKAYAADEPTGDDKNT